MLIPILEKTYHREVYIFMSDDKLEFTPTAKTMEEALGVPIAKQTEQDFTVNKLWELADLAMTTYDKALSKKGKYMVSPTAQVTINGFKRMFALAVTKRDHRSGKNPQVYHLVADGDVDDRSKMFDIPRRLYKSDPPLRHSTDYEPVSTEGIEEVITDILRFIVARKDVDRELTMEAYSAKRKAKEAKRSAKARKKTKRLSNLLFVDPNAVMLASIFALAMLILLGAFFVIVFSYAYSTHNEQLEAFDEAHPDLVITGQEFYKLTPNPYSVMLENKGPHEDYDAPALREHDEVGMSDNVRLFEVERGKCRYLGILPMDRKLVARTDDDGMLVTVDRNGETFACTLSQNDDGDFYDEPGRVLTQVQPAA